MYKKQLTVQKILCLAAVIMSALVFLYSLGIMTDLFDSLYQTIHNPNDPSSTEVPGSYIYYNMQGFNRMFLIFSIGLILLAVLLFITNTHKRRKYYIGNYIAIGLFAAGSVALTVFCHINIQKYRAEFLQIDFDALKKFSEFWKTLYTDSTFWFDIHYCVFGLLLCVAALLIANAIWKIRLMKAEAALVEEGRRVTRE